MLKRPFLILKMGFGPYTAIYKNIFGFFVKNERFLMIFRKTAPDFLTQKSHFSPQIWCF